MRALLSFGDKLGDDLRLVIEVPAEFGAHWLIGA
jgi:hypothetical protein